MATYICDQATAVNQLSVAPRVVHYWAYATKAERPRCREGAHGRGKCEARSHEMALQRKRPPGGGLIWEWKALTEQIRLTELVKGTRIHVVHLLNHPEPREPN